MTHQPPVPRRKKSSVAFTLPELLVVLGIIAMLAGLFMPSFSLMILKAQSTKCAANLRSIGSAASLCATDNGGQYPEINQNAGESTGIQVYPPGSGATNLIGALGSYGIATNNIECPVDMQNNPCSFTLYGSSYEWNPVFDDENTQATIYYVSQNIQIPVNSARVRLCQDFLAIHKNRKNAVYGDGHVTLH